MENSLKHRSEIPKELTWNLSSIYDTIEGLWEDINKMKILTSQLEEDYKGKLRSAKIINCCLDQLRQIYEYKDHIGSYVELALSVDYTNHENHDLYSIVSNIISDINSKLSFINSELVQVEEEILIEAMQTSKSNKGYLEDILRIKPHMLHPETEKSLAALSTTLEAPYFIYEQSKLADMQFDDFIVDGNKYPLGYALFENEYEYESDSKLRRAAFHAFSSKLKEYQYTTAAAYQTQVQKEKTLATLRGFDSVIDSLLFPQKVDRELFDRQIDLIMDKLAPHMRRYARLLKKVHKLDEMTFADLKITLDPEYDPKITIEESKKMMEEALAIYGEDYIKMIQSAYDDRWIDFAKNIGKSTGGFCASPYQKNSYILLSWSEKMAEVFVLAHELGHAGHFKLCNENQNIFDVDVSTYFVEAPSTMNELILGNHLMQSNKDKRFQRWVLSSLINHTYYHNFVTHLLEAAYQRNVYQIIDEGGAISASVLNKIKKEVLQKFWGEDVVLTDGAELTWMRQPHYYMGLYSYTYSAGLTIATQVSKRMQKEGAKAANDWKQVLLAGSTKTPVELAKMAGVDITTDEPLLDTIEHIGSMIDQIIALTDELEKGTK